MANNYDYITMLNMPEMSPPAASDTEFQNDLDLWLNTDFSFDPLDSVTFSDDSSRRSSDDFDYGHFKENYEQSLATLNDGPANLQPATQTALPLQPEPVAFVPRSTPVVIAPHPTGQSNQTQTIATPLLLNPAANAFNIYGSSVVPPANPGVTANLTLEQIIAAATALGTSAVPSTPEPAAIAQISPTSVAIPSPQLSDKEKIDDKTAEELDKRRRNTAASARFRAKKKQREQALEKAAKEMSEKAQQLERKMKEYEMELKWLRQLVTDRDGKKRLRDFYEESGLTFIEGTMAAGCGAEALPNPAAVPTANLAAAAAAFAGVMALAGQPLALPLPPDTKRRKLA